MPILFHPNPGTILTCDYTGLKEPEMVKLRPVVIVSPRSRTHGLVTIAPISTTAPEQALPWHYPLQLSQPLSPSWPELVVWVKCDMLNTLSSERLDRFHMRLGNHRKYYDRRVSDEDLAGIRKAMTAFFTG
jgi:uncharacterized protein YifN (PemK superfamily)